MDHFNHIQTLNPDQFQMKSIQFDSLDWCFGLIPWNFQSPNFKVLIKNTEIFDWNIHMIFIIHQRIRIFKQILSKLEYFRLIMGRFQDFCSIFRYKCWRFLFFNMVLRQKSSILSGKHFTLLHFCINIFLMTSFPSF